MVQCRKMPLEYLWRRVLYINIVLPLDIALLIKILSALLFCGLCRTHQNHALFLFLAKYCGIYENCNFLRGRHNRGTKRITTANVLCNYLEIITSNSHTFLSFFLSFSHLTFCPSFWQKLLTFLTHTVPWFPTLRQIWNAKEIHQRRSLWVRQFREQKRRVLFAQPEHCQCWGGHWHVRLQCRVVGQRRRRRRAGRRHPSIAVWNS